VNLDVSKRIPNDACGSNFFPVQQAQILKEECCDIQDDAFEAGLT
jgi:hypothetical protein